MTFPTIVRHTEADPEEAFTTPGWESRVYKLSTAPLRFLKNSLRLSDDVSLNEIHLEEGILRNVAEIAAGRLSIGFYKKDGRFGVSGNVVQDCVTSVAYSGSKWDVTAEAPGLALSIHFSPDAARNIVSSLAGLALLARMQTTDGVLKSVVFPITPTGERLRKAIDATFRLSERASAADEARPEAGWVIDDLMTETACLIDDLTDAESINSREGWSRRHLTAREIEKLLWRNPAEGGGPSSLDEFATYFGCSRRHVQKCVEEQFGVSFVTLKRFIRLQQVYGAMTLGERAHLGLGRLAADYEFEHLGRFSGYFKAMFGRTPSSMMKRSGDGEENDAET
jgi:AraC-like DNA-binding protein